MAKKKTKQKQKLEKQKGGAYVGAKPVEVIPIGRLSQFTFVYEQDYMVNFTFIDPETGNTTPVTLSGNAAKEIMAMVDRQILLDELVAEGYLEVDTVHVDDSDLELEPEDGETT